METVLELKHPLANELTYFALTPMLRNAALWRLYERVLVNLGHRFPTSRIVRALCRGSSQVVVKGKPGDTRRVAILRGGARVSIILDDYGMQGVLYYSGVYEPATTAVVLNLLRRGRRISRYQGQRRVLFVLSSCSWSLGARV
jgi:hypothetical protein